MQCRCLCGFIDNLLNMRRLLLGPYLALFSIKEETMRSMPLIILLLMIILLPVRSWADGGEITLKDLEQEALNNNPEIRMAEKRAESADEKKSLAAAMPDPMIGYAVRNVGSLGNSTVGKEEMSMEGFMITQEVPFPGKLSTKGNAARKRAEREQESARETKLRVLSTLRSAYYEFYLAYRSSEILTQTKDLMQNFQRIAEARYGTGQGMQQDVLRAQLEVTMLLDRLSEEERKKETQAAMINSLTGRNPLAPLGRPTELPIVPLGKSAEELAAMALAHSPALMGKQRMVEQSEFEVSMGRREFLPDMVVTAGRFTRGDMQDVWEATVMFKVPLYFWNKSTGVKAANADLRSAQYDFDATKLMVLARVRDLYATAKTSEHHLRLYDAGIIPQARMALQSTTSNYQVGKTDFLALLDSESLLLKYQLMEQEEQVNLHKTLSMIGEMTGEEHE
jgi:cobalt-zinc-cadmium efflux system outer membrane protein